MIKNILWDVDGTLLNFKESERVALSRCLERVGITPADDIVAEYSRINKKYWERLERNELTRDEVLLGRFVEFFDLIGKDVDVKKFEKSYQIALANVFFYCDDSLNLCKSLKEKGFSQYIVTNGVAFTQNKKLKDSGFDKVVDGIFISEEIGCPKPGIEFFRRVFARIPDFRHEETIIIGDSLTSDIKGGNNAGILTCWYNPYGEKPPNNVKIDFEIKNLWDVKKILEIKNTA